MNIIVMIQDRYITWKNHHLRSFFPLWTTEKSELWVSYSIELLDLSNPMTLDSNVCIKTHNCTKSVTLPLNRNHIPLWNYQTIKVFRYYLWYNMVENYFCNTIKKLQKPLKILKSQNIYRSCSKKVNFSKLIIFRIFH